MPSETSKTQENKHYMIPRTWGIQSGQIHGVSGQKGGCQRPEGRKEGSYCLAGTEFQFFRMERVLEMARRDGGTTI